jgi:diaminopimelate epimerase
VPARARFAKAHVVGNSYVVLREPASYHLSSKRARVLCCEATGVGAHGIVAAPESNPLSVRVFNADGSRAETSGNGLRIYAWWTVLMGDASLGEVFRLRSGHRIYPVRVVSRGGGRVGVRLGRPRVRRVDPTLWPRSVDVAGVWQVWVGNPHCCLLTSGSVSGFPLQRLASTWDLKALFPSGVNLEVFAPLSCSEIAARVWERGVGETPSSGSGSAAAAAAWKAGLAPTSVEVTMPGGRMLAERDGKGRIWSWAAVTEVCQGELALPQQSPWHVVGPRGRTAIDQPWGERHRPSLDSASRSGPWRIDDCRQK